jgi:hypothetical protein
MTLAEGLTLGFLEPDFRRSTILQGFTRHCRQGNKNPLVFAWLFLATVSPVEERIQTINALNVSVLKLLVAQSVCGWWLHLEHETLRPQGQRIGDSHFLSES